MFFEFATKNTFYELLIKEADFTLDFTVTSKKQSENESHQSKDSKESEVMFCKDILKIYTLNSDCINQKHLIMI